MEEITKRIKDFVDSRDWSKFHSGGNLAKAISIEANELLELFIWSDDTNKIDKLKDELADVLIYCILLSEKYDLNIKDLINNKIDKNSLKYPIEKSKGNSKKYNEFD